MHKRFILIVLMAGITLSGCQLISNNTMSVLEGTGQQRQILTLPPAPIIRPTTLTATAEEKEILNKLVDEIETSWGEGTIVKGDAAKRIITIVMGDVTSAEWSSNFDMSKEEGQAMWDNFRKSLIELGNTVNQSLKGYTLIVKDPMDISQDLIWVKGGITVYDHYVSSPSTPPSIPPVTQPTITAPSFAIGSPTKPGSIGGSSTKTTATKAPGKKPSANKPPAKNSSITIPTETAEEYTEKEFLDEVVKILREIYEDTAKIKSSVRGKWITVTPNEKGTFMEWLGFYGTRKEVRDDWDQIVENYIEDSKYIMEYLPRYTLKIMNPDNPTQAVLSVKDGVVLYNITSEITPMPSPTTKPPSTEPTTTEPPTTQPPSTEPPATQPPSTEPPSTEPPSTEPPSTEPPSTEPPSTEPPSTEPPSTEPPSTEPPSTEPPSTEPQTTEPQTTEPQTTEPPAAKPSVKTTPSTTAPTTQAEEDPTPQP